MELARTAEIHTPGSGGRRARFGSGYLLTDELVLTAGHAVGSAGSHCRVRPLGRKDWAAADVAWTSVTADAAVLRTAPPPAGATRWTPAKLGALTRDARVPCRALGFPSAQKRRGRTSVIRDTEEVTGEIAPLSAVKRGTLTIHISGSVPLDPGAAAGSPWAGMSGAGVFCGEALVGVVLVAPEHFGTDRLACVAVSTLAEDPGFRRVIADGAGELSLVSVEQELADWLPGLLWPVRADHGRFGGRDAELANLDAFLESASPATCLVTAPSGLGKTALLVNWLERLERRDDGPNVAYTFMSANLEQLGSQDFTLRVLSQQLASIHGLSDPLPRSIAELSVRYQKLVTRAPPARGVVIVVDGLDEARGWKPDAHLVPRPLPAGVRIVVSAREIAKVDWRKSLGLGADEVKPLALKTLGWDETSQLLERSRAPDWTRATEALRAIADTARGDPFYLRYLLDDIDAGRIVSASDLREQPQQVDDYLENWWQQVLASATDEAVRDLLGYVLASRGLLAREELISISNQDKLDAWTIDTALAAVARFVVGDDAGGYAISHARFGDYLREGPLQTSIGTYDDRLLKWCERWREHPQSSQYALRNYLYHLADAVERASDGVRQDRIVQLAHAIADEEFHLRHAAVIDDIPALERDLGAALGRVARAEPTVLEPIVRSVLAVESFRRDRLEPAVIYELAEAGRVADAEKRLELLALDDEWTSVAVLLIAWVAGDAAPADAEALLARRAGDVAPWPPIPLLDRRVRRWLSGKHGRQNGLSIPYPPSKLPAAPWEEEASVIVTSMGGAVEPYGHEAVEQLGRPIPGEGDEARAYVAERDSPALVAFAVEHPDPGVGLLSDYIGIHAANPYAEYRNRSLWAILGAASAHPDPVAARDFARQLVSAALAPPPVAFREGLGVTILALRAAADEPGALARFEQLEQEAAEAIARLEERRWMSDSWGHHCRRLAALAEAEACALDRRDRARALIAAARDLPRGFAGFRASACLTLAEAARICDPDDGAAGLDDVDAALTAAHNIQEPVLCAQRTARVNAMLDAWWPAPIAAPVAVLERFTTDPLAPEFAPLHIIGEGYARRDIDDERLSLPDSMLNAATLSQIADVHHVPSAVLEALNPAPDRRLRTRDPGFAAVLAARLAAEALADPGIPDQSRPALIAGLVPVAAAAPTPVHTVLSRLLLAARPVDVGDLQRLHALAPAEWLQEPPASTATEFGPA